MQKMNEYLPTTPFDLFELHLLHLVAAHGSFTRAGSIVGLTQSAVTRQIQGVEARIGMLLLERTTRQVRVSPAGEFLLRETSRVLGDIDSVLRRLREEFADAPKEVRVGVSRTIGLAYLPGFFFANQRKHPEVSFKVRHQSSQAILSGLEADELDVGVLCPPKKIPAALRITHRFKDAFVMIASEKLEVPQASAKGKTAVRWQQWVGSQNWLLIHERSNTGQRLRRWLARQGWKTPAAMEMDNFDLIINLVALGMGVSLVPHRALALYARKRGIRRVATPVRFTRELVVLVRKTRRPAPHVARFVDNILF